MPTRVYDLCRELAICGEVFVTFHPQPDGMVVIRQIPPVNVDDIETDPEDLERELRFHDSSDAGAGGKWWTSDRLRPLRRQPPGRLRARPVRPRPGAAVAAAVQGLADGPGED